MKTWILEDLDELQYMTESQRSMWIHQIDDRDLYEITQWLLVNLTAQRHERDHKRSELRDVLTWYYENEFWTSKQKHWVGHALIDYWPLRQSERDPRYLF
jgi:hypothetical protein